LNASIRIKFGAVGGKLWMLEVWGVWWVGVEGAQVLGGVWFVITTEVHN